MSVAAPVSSRVFDVPELRQRILRGLNPHNPAAPSRDLAICMRVSRRWMRDVAGLMFYSVPYYTAKYLMKLKKPTFSQLIYREAVTVIDLTEKYIHDALNPDLMRGLGRSPSIVKKKREGLLEELLGKFRGDVFNVLVPPLRAAFPRLRRIEFAAYRRGGGYGPRRSYSEPDMYGTRSPKWTVHFNSMRPALPAPSLLSLISEPTPPTLTEADRGHIVHVDEIICDDDTEPASVKPPFPSPPSELFTISNRFNFDSDKRQLIYGGIAPELAAKWKLALATGHMFDKLHHHINLRYIPITIDTLIPLYERQASAGFTDPLETIRGYNSGTFDLHDFQRFSSHASSLRVLEITSLGVISSSQIRFGDLGALIPMIKSRLPNLTHLTLELAGILSAERVCAGMLTDTTLEERGTLKVLKICTHVHDTPMFNILRSLSVLMRADSTIEVNNVAPLGFYASGVSGSRAASAQRSRPWGTSEQEAFRGYLKEQTPARRKHLSTIDFPSIGITKALQVRSLTYDDDDRPRYTPGVRHGPARGYRGGTVSGSEERSAGASDEEEEKEEEVEEEAETDGGSEGSSISECSAMI